MTAEGRSEHKGKILIYCYTMEIEHEYPKMMGAEVMRYTWVTPFNYG